MYPPVIETVPVEYRTRTSNTVVVKTPTDFIFPSHRDIPFGKTSLSGLASATKVSAFMTDTR